METYDIIIRVSRMGKRRESADPTMTLDDQEARCRQRIEAEHGGVGRVHDARDVSGWISVDSPAFRAALERVGTGQTHGFAVAYGDRLARFTSDRGSHRRRCGESGAHRRSPR